MSNGSCATCVLGGERFGEGRRFTSIYNGCGAPGHCQCCRSFEYRQVCSQSKAKPYWKIAIPLDLSIALQVDGRSQKRAANFISVATRAVNDFKEIETDFKNTHADISGPLTISVPREFGFLFLSRLLLTFNNKYPEIQLTADFDDRVIDP